MTEEQSDRTIVFRATQKQYESNDTDCFVAQIYDEVKASIASCVGKVGGGRVNLSPAFVAASTARAIFFSGPENVEELSNDEYDGWVARSSVAVGQATYNHCVRNRSSKEFEGWTEYDFQFISNVASDEFFFAVGKKIQESLDASKLSRVKPEEINGVVV